MSTQDLTTAASGGGGDAAPSAGAAAARGLGPRPWPRDFSTRVIPRFEPPYTLGEDVFSLSLGALNDVLSCLKLGDASQLRLVCRDAEAHVAAYKWADASTPVRSLKHWRAAFPAAVALRLHPSVTSPDWQLLRGLTTLSLSRCDLSQLRRSGLDDALADISLLDLKGRDVKPLVVTLLDATAPPQLTSAASEALLKPHAVKDGVGIVMHALDTPSLTAPQATTLCRALKYAGSSAFYDEEVCPEDEVLQREMAATLVAIMTRFPGEATLQEAALCVLQYFIDEADEPESVDGEVSEDAESYIGDEDDEDEDDEDDEDSVRVYEVHGGRLYMRPALPQLVPDGMIDATVAALNTHGTAFHAIAEAAALVLAAGAGHGMDVASEAVEAGALPALLNVLETHANTTPYTATTALKALAALTGQWSGQVNKAAFLEAGGLPRVLAAMRAMLGTAARYHEALQTALSLLHEVVVASPARATALVEAGGLEVLAASLEAGVEVREILWPAIELTRALVAVQEVSRQTLGSALVSSLLTVLSDNERSSVEWASSALKAPPERAAHLRRAVAAC